MTYQQEKIVDEIKEKVKSSSAFTSSFVFRQLLLSQLVDSEPVLLDKYYNEISSSFYNQDKKSPTYIDNLTEYLTRDLTTSDSSLIRVINNSKNRGRVLKTDLIKSLYSKEVSNSLLRSSPTSLIDEQKNPSSYIKSRINHYISITTHQLTDKQKSMLRQDVDSSSSALLNKLQKYNSSVTLLSRIKKSKNINNKEYAFCIGVKAPLDDRFDESFISSGASYVLGSKITHFLNKKKDYSKRKKLHNSFSGKNVGITSVKKLGYALSALALITLGVNMAKDSQVPLDKTNEIVKMIDDSVPYSKIGAEILNKVVNNDVIKSADKLNELVGQVNENQLNSVSDIINASFESSSNLFSSYNQVNNQNTLVNAQSPFKDNVSLKYKEDEQKETNANLKTKTVNLVSDENKIDNLSLESIEKNGEGKSINLEIGNSYVITKDKPTVWSIAEDVYGNNMDLIIDQIKSDHDNMSREQIRVFLIDLLKDSILKENNLSEEGARKLQIGKKLNIHESLENISSKYPFIQLELDNRVGVKEITESDSQLNKDLVSDVDSKVIFTNDSSYVDSKGRSLSHQNLDIIDKSYLFDLEEDKIDFKGRRIHDIELDRVDKAYLNETNKTPVNNDLNYDHDYQVIDKDNYQLDSLNSGNNIDSSNVKGLTLSQINIEKLKSEMIMKIKSSLTEDYKYSYTTSNKTLLGLSLDVLGGPDGLLKQSDKIINDFGIEKNEENIHMVKAAIKFSTLEILKEINGMSDIDAANILPGTKLKTPKSLDVSKLLTFLSDQSIVSPRLSKALEGVLTPELNSLQYPIQHI
ncbi:hypothetical protein [Photobacterium leiognathi]|uniref:hypothetical protein n=1 Tax=Photobacterium leiognathi TaxID=553611 RepID=UPI0029817F10|nr:hypothetical protein [Photobacterium leiognathi]